MPTTNCHPSNKTNNNSLNGIEIMAGGNIIMPIEIVTEATTTSEATTSTSEGTTTSDTASDNTASDDTTGDPFLDAIANGDTELLETLLESEAGREQFIDGFTEGSGLTREQGGCFVDESPIDLLVTLASEPETIEPEVLSQFLEVLDTCNIPLSAFQ